MNFYFWETFLNFSNQAYFSPLLGALNILLLFITAFINWLAWKTTNRANELQLLPLLAIYFKGTTIKTRKITIKNIGKSPAYNIKIDSFINILTDIQKVWKLDLKLIGTNVLVTEEERELIVSATSNNKPAEMADFMVFYLDPEEDHNRKRIDLIITFTNAEGHRYFSKIETGLGGLVMFPPKRINLYWKIYLIRRKLSEIFVIRWFQFLWQFREPQIKFTKKS